MNGRATFNIKILTKYGLAVNLDMDLDEFCCFPEWRRAASISVTADIARAGSEDMRFTEQMRRQFVFTLFITCIELLTVTVFLRGGGGCRNGVQEPLFMLVQHLTGGDGCYQTGVGGRIGARMLLSPRVEKVENSGAT
jgi:hypothetical protein